MADWLAVPAAHRGLHGPGRPENSLAAFAAAVEAGVGVELDVHAAAGEAVAVFHDPTLQRMCGVAGVIADQDAAALRRLRLAGTDERVPLLAEALELVAGRVPVLVELKSPVAPVTGAQLCARVLAALRAYEGPAAVMSFDPRLLRWFAAEAPHLPRGQLAVSARVAGVAAAAAAFGIPRWRLLALEHLAVNLVSRPSFVGYDVRALPHRAPRRARRRSRPPLSGIVRTMEELRTALEHADGAVFEDLPAAAVADQYRRRDE
jgi:glycerophosphoryl diester phosphodiesterase